MTMLRSPAFRASSWARPKFDMGGCVLYLPLWRPDMAGSTIISQEGLAQSFVATNTTWGYQGRTFAGADYLKYTVADWRKATDSAGSILLWFKTAADGWMFASCDEVGTNYYMAMTIEGTFLTTLQRNNDVTDLISGTTAVTDNAWYFGAVVSSGTAYTIYIDAIDEGALTVVSGANNGDWFADTTLRDNISIGAAVRSSVVGHLTGSVGDVLVYSKALTQAEIQNIYNATKWRYK